MNGYSILIADDEPIERDAFALYIQRNMPQVSRIITANDGVDMLQKAEALRPDIIVADVEMPGMTGLDTIGMLRKKGIRSRTIIYSAYNYFDYAKEALDLEADSYILKPAKRGDLQKAIAACIDKIEIERSDAESRLRAEELIAEALPILETDFISSILLDEINETTFRKYLALLKLDFASGCVATFRFPSFDIGDEIGRGNGLDPRAFIRAALSDWKGVLVGPIVNGKVTAFLCFDQDVSDLRIRGWIIKVAERACRRHAGERGKPLFAGIGNGYSDLRDLGKSYRQSLRALADTEGDALVRHFGDIGSACPMVDPLQRDEAIILKHFDELDEGKAAARIALSFEDLNASSLSLDSKKEAALAFVIGAWNRAREFRTTSASLKEVLDPPLKTLEKVGDAAGLLAWTQESSSRIIRFLREEKRSATCSHIRNAVRYIGQNYMKAISLDSVAEEIGVSPYYLSHLFKQELGMTYIKHLTDCRMKAATRILERERISPERLAPMVGYGNALYFCKLYKRCTGRSLSGRDGPETIEGAHT
jgi:two-component system, response regulator YesN